MIKEELDFSGTSIINRWRGGKKFKTAAERFFNNPKVKLSELREEMTKKCSDAEIRGHVLVLQDTTELNYNSHNGLLKVNDPDLGVISDNRSTGFMVHPGLAVEASSGIPYGICGVDMWERRFGAPSGKERNYSQQPIEEKESYKWLSVASQSKSNMVLAELTIVGDRENDIYEYFCRIPDERTHLLVRSSWNRKLSDGSLLCEHLGNMDWGGTFDLEIRGNLKRTARKAKMDVRWIRVEIAKPNSRKKILSEYPDSRSLYVVELKENPESVPSGEKPIYWRLFTTHAIDSLSEAIEVARWYGFRWWIEDFFRILKTQGLEIERSQLGTGLALKKLVMLCLEQALRILLLRQARNLGKNHPADMCFSTYEQQCMAMMNKELEGSTVRQKNPHAAYSLSWAVWIIARIAGWTPAELSKRPPGVITLARGLKFFNQQYNGWKNALVYLNQINKPDT